MSTFYQGALNSGYIDWLSKYDANIAARDGGSGTPTNTPSPPPTPTSTRTPTATRTSTPTVTLTRTPTPIGFLQAELIPNDSGGRFGSAVALSSDGNTALIGAPLKTAGGNFEQGGAYVFVRGNTTWTQQAVLTASDGTALDTFGWTVALSSDGNTALIGAPFKTVGGNAYEGVAYVFVRSGATWSQQSTLVASDGAHSDDFGCAVALSDDGAIALVGSQRNSGRGAAYVFVRSGVAWTEDAKLNASDAAVLDQFGSGVALSGDATIAFVGADEKNHGQGALYIFERNGSAWLEQTEIAAMDGAAIDNLGFAVAASGDGATVLVGAQNKDSGDTINQGAAYVGGNSSGGWGVLDGITAPHYIDSRSEDPAAQLAKMGGASVVLATVTNGEAMSAAMGGLGIKGSFIVLGVPEAIEVSPLLLIRGCRTIAGWYSGTSMDSQDTLAFSVLTGARSMNEVFPLERVADAYEHMMSGQARFRVVLTMG